MAQTPCLFVNAGESPDYLASADNLAGDVVVVGTIPAIVARPIDFSVNALGAVHLEGMFDVPQAAEIITAGDAVYWDANGNPYGGTALSGCATGTASGNNLMGVAAPVQPNGTNATTATDSYVRVIMTAAKRTTTIAGSVTADDITASDATLNVAGLDAAQGGLIAIAGGTSSTGGNAGGLVSLTGGTPGVTGVGGAASVVGGAGGTTSGTGGAASLAGGAAASAASNAIGGAASVVGGIGKGNLAGGGASVTGGVGGATGAGGAIAIAGGAGGSASGTGGAVTIAGGAGSAGNADGGAMSVLGGNAHGSGTDGALNLGTSNTASVAIAAASIATAMPGPVNRVAGASTAAAGSTAGDAGALPAGTASVYPTTAADDTKGVILNAADKVTGRTLMIGNGVSNKILKVYPPTGGNINALGANAAFSSASGKGVIIHCLDSGANTWLAS